MAESSKQASWASALPTTTGRRAPDGRRIYRMTGPQVTWWVWIAVTVLGLGDLVFQGHDLSSLRFALGLLTVTGLVFACTIWPRVIASQDDMTVHNPFRTFVIPWLGVKQVRVADSVQVCCARRPPKKDKTVYSWALASSRRANSRSEMRARQWERGGRSRPAGWDRMPESAKEIAKMTSADLIARELASIARYVRAEYAGVAGVSAGSPPVAGVAGGSGGPTLQASVAAGSGESAFQASTESDGALDRVVSGRWAWQPIVVILAPGVAFAIAMLIK